MPKKDVSDRKNSTHNNVLMDFGSPWDSIIPSNDATNNFISGIGMVFNHYVAIPNVIHESNIGDLRRLYDEDANSQFVKNGQFDFIENGFLYKFKGQVWGIFTGNNKQFNQIASGLYSASGAFVTFNRYYRSTNKYASFMEYDKLIPCITGKEFFSTHFEKTTVNSTGINRLQFPACEIEHIIDSNGQEYLEGRDFDLMSGYIKWIDGTGANRPGIDWKTNKGRVIGIRYRYKPTFYVQALAHDIRMYASFDATGESNYSLSTKENGEIEYKSGPTSVNIVADYIFLDRRTAEPDKIDAQLDDDDSDNGNVGPR